MLDCERGCPDTVALLVNAGCDTSARNSHGRTGWELAKVCGHTQVMHLLELYAYGGQAKKGHRENNGNQARKKIDYGAFLAQVGLACKIYTQGQSAQSCVRITVAGRHCHSERSEIPGRPAMDPALRRRAPGGAGGAAR